MADQRTVELLAFNFASRTFAYKRLAQGLSRALSAFSSFMREYLDRVIKADQCTQNVDDIGIAANSVKQLIRNIKAVFDCTRQACLELAIKKCHFEVTKVEFLGETITSQGVAPQDHTIKKFLANVRFPKIQKTGPTIHRIRKLLQNPHTQIIRKNPEVFLALKDRQKITITEDLLDDYKAINTALTETCGLVLKQPIKGRQYVIMADASIRTTGYALMIEEKDDKKLTSKKKTFAPVAFGSKVFSPAQLKMSLHVAGTLNTAADFLSRLEVTPKEKIELRIREDIRTTPIQIINSYMQSTDVADDEQQFFLLDEQSETEEEILQR